MYELQFLFHIFLAKHRRRKWKNFSDQEPDVIFGKRENNQITDNRIE